MRWRYYTGTNQTVIQLVIGGALSRLRKLKDVGQSVVVVVVVVVVAVLKSLCVLEVRSGYRVLHVQCHLTKHVGLLNRVCFGSWSDVSLFSGGIPQPRCELESPTSGPPICVQ